MATFFILSPDKSQDFSCKSCCVFQHLALTLINDHFSVSACLLMKFLGGSSSIPDIGVTCTERPLFCTLESDKCLKIDTNDRPLIVFSRPSSQPCRMTDDRSLPSFKTDFPNVGFTSITVQK